MSLKEGDFSIFTINENVSFKLTLEAFKVKIIISLLWWCYVFSYSKYININRIKFYYYYVFILIEWVDGTLPRLWSLW